METQPQENSLTNQAPIPHWSYSSLCSFLDDPIRFKKRSIEKIYGDLKSPSMIVGIGCHEAAHQFLKGFDQAYAINAGLEKMAEFMDAEIRFGKTGSREKMLKDFTQGMQFFFQELPDFWKKGKVLNSEKETTTFIVDENGKKFPLPLKSIRDLDYENENQEPELWDYKFVGAYSDSDEEDPVKIVQAMFYYFTYLADYGVAPLRCVFYEVKYTKNTNGDDQCQKWVLEYEKYPQYFTFFYKILGDATAQICNPTYLYLPNIRSMSSGKDSFSLYMNGILGAEAPVAVPFKTKQEVYVEKKFVQSAHDQVVNINLSEEEKIRTKLQEFGLPVQHAETHTGSSVILYAYKPSRGCRMSSFDKHAKDIAIALKAPSIRVLAPIWGTDTVGFEIPNPQRHFVEAPMPKETGRGTLAIPLGVDVYGIPHVSELNQMPHLLVAGTTGSGKSVFLNVLIRALIAQNTTETLSMVLVDPKRVEFADYATCELLGGTPIINEDKEAAEELRILVAEMEHRFKILEKAKKKNIEDYNQTRKSEATKMKRVVIIIDEYADLILGPMGDMVEDAIIRLTQKARAVGIHLVLTTQRPTVDIVKGRIKANVPFRISFRTVSQIDSMTILDSAGAEALTGKGDMLVMLPGGGELLRLQGYFVK